MSPEDLSIGELAARSGVATSALRYYEEKGLLDSARTHGNQRRYRRAALRRVSVIRAAQSVGLTLAEIERALAELPGGRTPTKSDWERMSLAWEAQLNRRIAELEAVRDDLASCIGCGCLSLESCALFNPADGAAALGSGPRYLLGDRPQAP